MYLAVQVRYIYNKAHIYNQDQICTSILFNKGGLAEFGYLITEKWHFLAEQQFLKESGTFLERVAPSQNKWHFLKECRFLRDSGTSSEIGWHFLRECGTL